MSQVKGALKWLLTFAKSVQAVPLKRTYHLADRTAFAITIEADGSPWGGGALAWHGDPATRGARKPFAWFACPWNASDEAILKAQIGSPDGQARWEGFSFLLAIRQWITPGLVGRITLVGDAEGVLGALAMMRSSDPVINSMAQEIALWLAPKGLALESLHVWGEENRVADRLSRIAQGAAVPALLGDVSCAVLSDRTTSSWSFLK